MTRTRKRVKRKWMILKKRDQMKELEKRVAKKWRKKKVKRRKAALTQMRISNLTTTMSSITLNQITEMVIFYQTKTIIKTTTMSKNRMRKKARTRRVKMRFLNPMPRKMSAME